ncbi:MAG: SHOCT domain-containing protein [Actinobacteria bacterium]|nr:MAG: SHOCT domain-containing protein [Actinomycetota bacterium]
MGQPYGPWQGPGFEHHGAWWGILHLLPFVMLLLLIGVGIWAVIRFTSRPIPLGAGVGPAPLPPRDPALEELRIRYARGELEREDFAQRMRDLGGTDIGDRASPVDRSVPPDDSAPASG